MSAPLGLLRRLTLTLVTVLLLALALGGVPTTAQASEKSNARRATVRGTLVALPPVVQPGTSPAAPAEGSSLVATFRTPTPGQKVVLERQGSRGWKAVDSDRQDAWGAASFSVRPGTYRASTTADGRTWTTGTVRAKSWAPAFEDTFSGSALDGSVWNDQVRDYESVYAARTCTRTDARARRVAGGVLHLGVIADPDRVGTPCSYTTPGGAGTSPYLLTSQVSTEHTRTFQHGIVAARIKPQRAKGMHSGFWMLPQGTKFTDGDAAAGTEIDVMEFFGENGRGTESIASHVYYYEPNWTPIRMGGTFTEARKSLSAGRDWWEEFHVFSVEWTPTEYVFRIDGREYHRETKAVSQAQEYLVLSMLASDHELAELTAAELSDTAQVDWVRVFDATSAESVRTTRGRAISARR